MTRLDRLMQPLSVAVIGAGLFVPNVVKLCLKLEFAGGILPVQPSCDEVAGVRAYKSLSDLPAVLDATFIAVNRTLILGVVRELSERIWEATTEIQRHIISRALLRVVGG